MNEFDPGFKNVKLKDFIKFLCKVFFVEDKEIKTPYRFSQEVAERAYESWQGGAQFYALPTPQNKWGWMYETISERKLIWLPSKKLLTRGMKESQNFREELERNFGRAGELSEPEWLEAALTLRIEVQRPCIYDYRRERISEPNNDLFFASIRRKPFEIYGEFTEAPVAPLWIYFYAHASSGKNVIEVAKHIRKTKDEEIYNALKTLRATTFATRRKK